MIWVRDIIDYEQDMFNDPILIICVLINIFTIVAINTLMIMHKFIWKAKYH